MTVATAWPMAHMWFSLVAHSQTDRQTHETEAAFPETPKLACTCRYETHTRRWHNGQNPTSDPWAPASWRLSCRRISHAHTKKPHKCPHTNHENHMVHIIWMSLPHSKCADTGAIRKQHLAFFTSDVNGRMNARCLCVGSSLIHAYSVKQAWNFLNNSATILAGQP